MSLESDLYAPVKALLEGQGYSVKGEVRGCDVVAVRGGEPPLIVELKRAFGMALVLQGVRRLALSDAVYLAVGAWPKNLRDVKKLCRRLVAAHGDHVAALHLALDAVSLPFEQCLDRRIEVAFQRHVGLA